MIERQESLLRSYFRGDRFAASPDLGLRVRASLGGAGAVRRSDWARLWPTRRGARLMLLAAAVAALGIAVSATPLAAPAATIPAAFAQAIGLSAVLGHIQPEQESATSSGYTITIVGAYADATRTVILMRTQPAGAMPVMIRMTDASGHDIQELVSLAGRGGSGDGLSASQFLPLPQIGKPAPVTIQVTELISVPPVPSSAPGLPATPAPEKPHLVKGSWMFHLTVANQGGREVAVPSGSAGPDSVTFSSVRVARGAVAALVTLHGPDLRGPIRAHSIELLDPQGNVITGGYGWSPLSPTTLEYGGFWIVPSPGLYRIRVTAPNGAVVERTVQAL